MYWVLGMAIWILGSLFGRREGGAFELHFGSRNQWFLSSLKGPDSGWFCGLGVVVFVCVLLLLLGGSFFIFVFLFLLLLLFWLVV